MLSVASCLALGVASGASGQAIGGEGSFLLSEPGSEVYYTHAVAAGGDVDVAKDAVVSGAVHSNADVRLRKDATVEGDVSAVGTVDLDGAATGTVTEGAEPLELPALAGEAAWRARADRVLEGRPVFVFTELVVDDVLFVDGRVQIERGLDGEGTLVATGEIRLVNAGEEEEGGGPIVLEERTRLSLVSFGDVRIGNDRPFRGVVRAGGDVDVRRGGAFDGVVVADGEVTIAGETLASFVDFDTTPPEIALVSPADGSFVGTPTPTVVVELSDDFSGLDLATLELLVDGTDRAAEATVTETGVTWTPAAPLAEGAHALEVAIRDISDNEARESFSFVVDLTAPTIVAVLDPEANAAGWNATDVTVSFLCEDALSGVAECPEPVVVAGDCVEQEVTGSATDNVGNASSTSLVVRVDRLPPEITATLDPAPNAAGWNAGPVTVSFAAEDACSGIAEATAPVTVTDEGADREVPGSATDLAGNSATTVATVSIDLTPPAFDPAELRPLPCPELTLEIQPQVRACFADALSGVAEGSVQLTVDGVDRSAAAVVADGCIAWDPPEALVPGEHQAQIAAVDVAGNPGSRAWCFDVASPALDIEVDSPVQGFATNLDTVDVFGTVDPLAETVEVGGVQATVASGTFEALGVPLREGKNVVTAVASNSFGAIGTASVTVSRDTTPPVVRIETPRAGALLTALQVDVAGLVNDLVTGTTINADDCRVSINGVEAEVANRTFVVPNLLLKRGVNTLVAEARDRLGNVATHSIEVTVADQAGQRIRLLAGGGQSAEVFEDLPDPVVVVLEDANGDPVPARPVSFAVTRGDGTLSAFPQEGTTVTVTTDELGHARARFTLGGRSGAGNNRVRAVAPGFLGEVELCFSATTGPPARITPVSGGGQRGVVERELPLPLVALVTDAGGNPVGGVRVDFEVTDGGGTLGAGPVASAFTDLDGLVQAVWTLGPDEGINNNGVKATFPGLVEPPARYTATAQRIGRPSDTRISGVVLDNQDNPVPGVTVHVEDTALTAVTDAEGRFAIADAPVGSVLLSFDGSTTSLPGVWPALEFELTTVSGRDNGLGRPVYLLPLDDGAVAGGPADVSLTLDNVPGAELTVFADSVTCPDGSPTCEIRVTQVRGERVPMEPPMGSSFMLAWTIQPAGTRFDPPARLCIPNDGQPPGQQVEMFSFDHDLGEFIVVGTATVTEDGTQICSDPGFGVVKAGWHGCVPPPPPPKCTISCNDRNECTDDNVLDPPCACEHPPGNEGAACGEEPGPNSCRERGVCEGGSCTGKPKDDGSNCDDGLHCTEMDRCEGGVCKGEEIEPEVLDAEKFELAAVNNVLQKVQQWLNLVQIKSFTVPKFGGSLVFQRKRVCCEQKMGQMTLESSGGGVLSLPFWKTPRVVPTIPPWSGDFTITIFGRPIGVAYGIFVEASGSGRASLKRTVRECEEDTCWSGSMGITASGNAGVFGEVPNPALPPECGPKKDMDCAILRLEGFGSTGFNVGCVVGCDKATCDAGHNGITINGKIILLEGTWFEVKATKTFTPVDPGGLGDIEFFLPD